MKVTFQTLRFVVAVMAIFCISCETEEPDTLDQSPVFRRFFGTASNEIGSDFEQIPEGDIFLVGTTFSNVGRSSDIYLVRSNAFGELVWEKTLGGTGTDAGSDILVVDDRLYVLGFVTSGSQNEDMVLMTLDFEGQVLDSVTFGQLNTNERGISLTRATNGDLTLVGSASDQDDVEMFVIRLNEAGQEVFSRSFGLFNQFDSISGVVETTTNNLVWTGIAEQSDDNRDIRITSANSDGTILWDLFWDNNAEDRAAALIEIPGGFAIAGSTVNGDENSNGVLLAFNVSGELLWERVHEFEGQQAYLGLDRTNDGGFILTGYTRSAGASRDIFLVKTDQTGTIEWTQSFGFMDDDQGNSVGQTAEGNFIIVGTSNIENNDVIELIKTSPNGELN